MEVRGGGGAMEVIVLGALESFFKYDDFKEFQIHVLFIIIQLPKVECKWRANRVHISCDIVR